MCRLLNVSENLFDDSNELSVRDMDSVRQSFIFKILQRLAPSHGGNYEDHLNA